MKITGLGNIYRGNKLIKYFIGLGDRTIKLNIKQHTPHQPIVKSYYVVAVVVLLVEREKDGLYVYKPVFNSS